MSALTQNPLRMFLKKRHFAFAVILTVSSFISIAHAGATPAATDIQPSFPIRAALYYPWFPEAWNQQGFNPFTNYTPSLGSYDLTNQTVISQQIAAMQYGGIQAGIASWWGQGTKTDARIPSLLQAAAGTSFRWALYYEQESLGDPSVSQLTSDLTYVRDHYGSDPSFLRVGGRFVVFVYADGADACGMADRWKQANTLEAYVVLKVFSGYTTCINQPDGWHQYNPAVAADSQKSYSYMISPGFWKKGEAVRLDRNITRWNQNIRNMIASGAPFQLVTTFNEWGEGTPVESAVEWTSVSGYGVYLDALHNNGQLDPTNLSFQEIATGLTKPLFITNAGDGSRRIFFVEQPGRVRIQKNGALLTTPFLDIQAIIKTTGSEQGLLSLAFDPAYATNGNFYVVYTAPRNGDSTGSNLVLEKFSVSTNNPDQANPNSGIILLTISHPVNSNHNGGTLAFGQDGYLYWSKGDGGSGGDPPNNAQQTKNLLGKILRIDVHSGSPYRIPASNPFYSSIDPNVKKEIWAYGLRNPWRFSFDRSNHNLYIGDVGKSAREEVDFQLASSTGGENYGWRVMEGSLCLNPASGCDKTGKILPVAEYDHTLDCAITGGYVYRGSNFPSLYGFFFFWGYFSGKIF